MEMVNRQPDSFSIQNNDKVEGTGGKNNFFDRECCYSSLVLVSLKDNPFFFLLFL